MTCWNSRHMIAIKVCRERGGRRGEYPDVRGGWQVSIGVSGALSTYTQRT